MTVGTKAHQVASIQEDLCIGCTKCINACPVDAILGAKNLMHTVIADECIGCKLCIPPCPADCIEMVDASTAKPEPDLVKQRHRARKLRLSLEDGGLETTDVSAADKKQYVLDALARVRKRGSGTKS